MFAARLLVVFVAALSATAASAQTLDRVRERGFLVCGATDPLPGFAAKNAEGVWVGFDVDLCRAIAAATLGDPNLVEFRPVTGEARFVPLQTGELDLMVRNGAWTLERDLVYGVRYLSTTFFDGLTFMVGQDSGIVSAYVMDDLTVCVSRQGSDLESVRNFFFDNQSTFTEIIYEERTDVLMAYRNGLCDAVAAPLSRIQALRRTLDDPGQHRILPELITKAPLGPVILAGDAQWQDIVRWTVFALINAEELGVTSSNLESMTSSRTPAIRRLLGNENDFGTVLGLDAKWASRIIAAVGNYREMYDRHFGPQTGAALQRGMNALWTQGGLLFAPPIR